MVYETVFLIGLIGIVAMGVLGFAHGAHHGPAHHHHGIDFNIPHGAVHGAASTHGHAGHAGHAHHGQGQASEGRLPWFFVSPLAVFSVCIGAGAVGMLLHRQIDARLMAVVAVATGLLFNAMLIRPITNLILAFGAKPSEGLEGTVAQTAEAVTNFDGQGQGLVRLTLDGEVVQILGRLQPSETGGDRVLKGDRLVVLEVDPHRNMCLVTKELS